MIAKPYYPTRHLGCNPIHPVRDWAKVRKLVRDARRGAAIPAIVIDGDIGSGNMLNGTHRAAANDLLIMLGGEALIPVIGIEDVETDYPVRLDRAIADLDYEVIDWLLDRKNVTA